MEISLASPTSSFDSQIQSLNSTSNDASSNEMIDSSEVKIEDQDEERESSGDSSEFSVPAASSSSVARNVFDDDDEDEDVCRICRNPGEADNPLRYLCACSGSIKFVHQDCLLQWLNHSNARQCEVG